MEQKSLIRFDWAIKRLLRNKADYTVLEGFLSVLLNEQIKIVNIKESESNRTHPEDKFNRVDILAEDIGGQLVLIEIQNNSEADYLLRMLYAVSKAVIEQLKKGDRYGKIRKVYHINIIYFTMGDGEDYVYHGIADFRGIHHNNILKLTEEQKKFFLREHVEELFPEYYILCTRDFHNIVKDDLDQWMYYLKNTEIPDHFTSQGLKEARELLVYDRLSKEEQGDYDHHLSQTRYEQNVIEDSYTSGQMKGQAEGRAEGRAEGQAEGRAEGLTEGEAIGFEKGRTETLERIVIDSKNNGLSLSQIESITKLSGEQIIGILKQHK